MGTRINAVFSHAIVDHTNVDGVMTRLKQAEEAIRILVASWDSVGQPEELRWQIHHWPPKYDDGNLRITGPLFLTISPVTVHVRAGGRWRGFLSIPELRDAHLRAIRAIARSFGASRLAWFLDTDSVVDTLVAGGAFDNCVEELHRCWGPPEPAIDHISHEIAAETERGVPTVWYLDCVDS